MVLELRTLDGTGTDYSLDISRTEFNDKANIYYSIISSDEAKTI